MTTSADIVNRAVLLVGGFNDNGPISGTPPAFDGTPIGIAAGILYPAVVQTVGRQFGWDFSRATGTLTLSGNVAPSPWSYEYLYPTNGLQVRQVLPAAASIDLLNPLPLNWSVGNSAVSGIPRKVVLTNIANAQAVFTNQPPEDAWDALFAEAVVRLLASELAMAIESKPDTARDALLSGAQFEQIGEGRDD